MDKKVFIEKFTGKLPKDLKQASPQQIHSHGSLTPQATET